MHGWACSAPGRVGPLTHELLPPCALRFVPLPAASALEELVDRGVR